MVTSSTLSDVVSSVGSVDIVFGAVDLVPAPTIAVVNPTVVQPRLTGGTLALALAAMSLLVASAFAVTASMLYFLVACSQAALSSEVVVPRDAGQLGGILAPTGRSISAAMSVALAYGVALHDTLLVTPRGALCLLLCII